MIVKKLHYLMWANFRPSFFFSFGLAMQFFNVLMGACSYFFLTQLFPQGGSEALSPYGANAVSYIIVGMALSPMLALSASGLYSSLVNSYYNRTLERISMSRTSVFSLFLSEMLSSFLASALTAFLYLLFGVLLFHVAVGLMRIRSRDGRNHWHRHDIDGPVLLDIIWEGWCQSVLALLRQAFLDF